MKEEKRGKIKGETFKRLLPIHKRGYLVNRSPRESGN